MYSTVSCSGVFDDNDRGDNYAVNGYVNNERIMSQRDADYMCANDARNELEAYCLTTSSSLNTSLDLIYPDSVSSHQRLRDILVECFDWLYDETNEYSASVYKEKLSNIRTAFHRDVV